VFVFFVILQHAAQHQTPEDTRTILGISRLGLVCKLSHVLGLRLPLVEAARFSFFPAGHSTMLNPRAAGLPLQAMLQKREGRRSERSGTLVVAFSGGATNKIGLARLEFRRMLSEAGTSHVDQLYVLDPTGMSFYEHRLSTFQAQLRECLRPYSRVIFLGNCMGATAALRFAGLLRHKHDMVLAFNPEVVPGRDSRKVFRIAACLSPTQTSKLRGVLERAVLKTSAQIRVHVSAWPPELSQGRLLFDSVDGDDVIVEVDAEMAVADGLRQRVLPRVLRIIHHQCTYHGLLAKCLRPTGALRGILDRAVGPR